MRYATTLLICVTGILFLSQLSAASDTDISSDEQVRDALVSLEKQSWVAWKARDGHFFENFLSVDHVEVGIGGFANKAAVVSSVSGPVCDVKSYVVTDFHFTRIADDTAALNYRAEQKTTCGGIPVPTPAWATSVYVRRNGKWLNVLYQQTPVAAS